MIIRLRNKKIHYNLETCILLIFLLPSEDIKYPKFICRYLYQYTIIKFNYIDSNVLIVMLHKNYIQHLNAYNVYKKLRRFCLGFFTVLRFTYIYIHIQKLKIINNTICNFSRA